MGRFLLKPRLSKRYGNLAKEISKILTEHMLEKTALTERKALFLGPIRNSCRTITLHHFAPRQEDHVIGIFL